MIILDEVLMFANLVIVILYIIFLGFEGAASHIYGGVLAFLSMYSLKILGDKLFKKESLGGGDIKLLFFLGFILGWPQALLSIFLGSIIGLPISLIVLKIKNTNIIPFGPFLALGAIIILLTQFNIEILLNALTI